MLNNTSLIYAVERFILVYESYEGHFLSFYLFSENYSQT
jgi:hypothetical protein